MKLIAIGVSVMLFGCARPSQTPAVVPATQAPTTVQHAVQRTAAQTEIDRWESDNAFEVTSDAESKIADALKEVPENKIVAITHAYLFELRDLAGGQITAEEVDTLPPKTYLAALGFRKPTGVIRVESTPAGVQVLINGKPKGFTPRSYVMHTGRHEVRLTVGSRVCRQKVQLVEDSTAKVVCPP